MANTKPFVAAAFLCEKLLQDQDGVASAIRIVDTFTLELPDNPPQGMTTVVEMQLFVSLKSGDVKGESELAIVLHRPSGKTDQARKFPIVLEGGVHGANFGARLHIQKPEFGTYWFDVLWNNEQLTRIPFVFRKPESAANPKPEQT